MNDIYIYLQKNNVNKYIRLHSKKKMYHIIIILWATIIIILTLMISFMSTKQYKYGPKNKKNSSNINQLTMQIKRNKSTQFMESIANEVEQRLKNEPIQPKSVLYADIYFVDSFSNEQTDKPYKFMELCSIFLDQVKDTLQISITDNKTLIIEPTFIERQIKIQKEEIDKDTEDIDVQTIIKTFINAAAGPDLTVDKDSVNTVNTIAQQISNSRNWIPENETTVNFKIVTTELIHLAMYDRIVSKLYVDTDVFFIDLCRALLLNNTLRFLDMNEFLAELDKTSLFYDELSQNSTVIDAWKIYISNDQLLVSVMRQYVQIYDKFTKLFFSDLP